VGGRGECLLLTGRSLPPREGVQVSLQSGAGYGKMEKPRLPATNVTFNLKKLIIYVKRKPYKKKMSLNDEIKVRGIEQSVRMLYFNWS